ncbi:Threonine aldolase [Rhizophlyctis rosea]|nr:Threonine aldolase [Rhizophlyctis rosea]
MVRPLLHHFRTRFSAPARAAGQHLARCSSSTTTRYATSREVAAGDILYDLRSDTVTKPTRAMLEAMARAEVGDDVYDEDPTVNKLQSRVADMTGHEAALFCPTATMTNQIAIRTHLTQPPYSIICDSRSHIFNYEAAGASFHSGAGVIPIKAHHLTIADIQKQWIIDDDIHHAPTKLVCLENTLDGEIFPIDEIRQICDTSRQNGIRTHLDGARLWNASVATGIELKDWCRHFDSVSLCFSKGLGAPIGSILVGPQPFIRKAKHFRKLFGGGWRQSGLLAAAALHSLNHHLPLLHHDHENATLLATGLSKLWFRITKRVDTNMVWAEAPVSTADEIETILREAGVRCFGGEGTEMRFVVHSGVGREGVEYVLGVLEKGLGGGK